MKIYSACKKCLMAILMSMTSLATFAQETVELTMEEAVKYYQNTTKQRVSCHDPSVVWEPTKQRFYIFGSHLAHPCFILQRCRR